uniref:Uncharacterized protein n=1 Tax=Timema monikensis TaxID=170555 RepID=A0A7R9HKR4_9NEOP|nr:unnamed protein product [Timema monikensis]
MFQERRAKSVAGSLGQAAAYINVMDLFRFRAMRNISQKDLVELRRLGFIYFVYLFLYSGLEFTLTFLTHHTFNYTSMQQGWMFFAIGVTMALMQGGYVRRLPEHKIRPTAVLWVVVILKGRRMKEGVVLLAGRSRLLADLDSSEKDMVGENDFIEPSLISNQVVFVLHSADKTHSHGGGNDLERTRHRGPLTTASLRMRALNGL